MLLECSTLLLALASTPTVGPATAPGVAPVAAPAVQARGKATQGGGRAGAPARAGSSSGRTFLGASRPGASAPAGPGATTGATSEPQAAEPGGPRVREVVDPTTVQEVLEGYFTVADYDGNEWISFREARASLRLSRDRFQVYDADRDGRLVLDEFGVYHSDAVRQLGSFRDPKPEERARPPQRPPKLLVNTYDVDLDGALGLIEVGRLLVDYQREDVSADAVLASLDRNQDRLLHADEMEGLAGILYPVVLSEPEPSGEGEPPPPRPASVVELFGQPELRSEASTLAPPRIAGPVPVFHRLDLDGDGGISVRDLEGLLRPVQIPVRVSSIFSLLDADHDGRLSVAEFERALSDHPDE